MHKAQSKDELISIRWAIGGMLVIALTLAAAIAAALLVILPFRPFKPEALSATTLYDLLKVAFAFAAGIGGVVALVVAYRRQRISEFAHELAARIEERTRHDEQQRNEIARRAERREATRLLNERFTTTASQLGNDSPAIRLAGVYAMAGLADDWPEQRQTCVDVLCAYLRMPYEYESDEDIPDSKRVALQAACEVRSTITRVIASHLQPDSKRPSTAASWHGLDFDFNGASFDFGNFSGAQFTSGRVDFTGAEFCGLVSFMDTVFSGSEVSFFGTEFTSGKIFFCSAEFSGGEVDFTDAEFSGSEVDFSSATFSGGKVDFCKSKFSDGTVDFRYVADWSLPPQFPKWIERPASLLLPDNLNTTSSDPASERPTPDTPAKTAAALTP